MFNLFKKKKKEPEIRNVLFGDLPLSEWPKELSVANEEPWASFVAARDHMSNGQPEKAIEAYRNILAMPQLESRHYLQAWHFLRSLGVHPQEEISKELFGVVVEVALDRGLDIVVAYSDLSARYFNYSGAAVIWDNPDNTIQNEIKGLLHAGEVVVSKIGPWEDPRPPAPGIGEARISMLTPSGLHFGQAPMDDLAADQLGGPVIHMATQLMQRLIEKGQ